MNPYPDLLSGGRADQGLRSEPDPEEMNRGIEVEMEHTSNPMLAAEIARDHLAEDPHYYTKLAKIHRENRCMTTNEPLAEYIGQVLGTSARALGESDFRSLRPVRIGTLSAGSAFTDRQWGAWSGLGHKLVKQQGGIYWRKVEDPNIEPGQTLADDGEVIPHNRTVFVESVKAPQFYGPEQWQIRESHGGAWGPGKELAALYDHSNSKAEFLTHCSDLGMDAKQAAQWWTRFRNRALGPDQSDHSPAPMGEETDTGDIAGLPMGMAPPAGSPSPSPSPRTKTEGGFGALYSHYFAQVLGESSPRPSQLGEGTLPTYNERRGWTGGDPHTLYAYTDKRTGKVQVQPGGSAWTGGGPELSVRVATRSEAEAHWQRPLSKGWTVSEAQDWSGLTSSYRTDAVRMEKALVELRDVMGNAKVAVKAALRALEAKPTWPRAAKDLISQPFNDLQRLVSQGETLISVSHLPKLGVMAPSEAKQLYADFQQVVRGAEAMRKALSRALTGDTPQVLAALRAPVLESLREDAERQGIPGPSDSFVDPDTAQPEVELSPSPASGQNKNLALIARMLLAVANGQDPKVVVQAMGSSDPTSDLLPQDPSSPRIDPTSLDFGQDDLGLDPIGSTDPDEDPLNPELPPEQDDELDLTDPMGDPEDGDDLPPISEPGEHTPPDFGAPELFPDEDPEQDDTLDPDLDDLSDPDGADDGFLDPEDDPSGTTEPDDDEFDPEGDPGLDDAGLSPEPGDDEFPPNPSDDFPLIGGSKQGDQDPRMLGHDPQGDLGPDDPSAGDDDELSFLAEPEANPVFSPAPEEAPPGFEAGADEDLPSPPDKGEPSNLYRPDGMPPNAGAVGSRPGRELSYEGPSPEPGVLTWRLPLLKGERDAYDFVLSVVKGEKRGEFLVSSEVCVGLDPRLLDDEVTDHFVKDEVLKAMGRVPRKWRKLLVTKDEEYGSKETSTDLAGLKEVLAVYGIQIGRRLERDLLALSQGTRTFNQL